jgi:hypothetical protein
MMKKPTLFLILSILISACSPTPTAVPSSPIPNQNIPAENTAVAAPITDTATPMFEPGAPLPATAAPTGNLSLQVLSPLDEAIVNTPQVDVLGTAPAGAVLNINDEILLVGDDGQFKATVSLEEGPNLIEILASDVDGNESSLFLTITYEP